MPLQIVRARLWIWELWWAAGGGVGGSGCGGRKEGCIWRTFAGRAMRRGQDRRRRRAQRRCHATSWCGTKGHGHPWTDTKSCRLAHGQTLETLCARTGCPALPAPATTFALQRCPPASQSYPEKRAPGPSAPFVVQLIYCSRFAYTFTLPTTRCCNIPVYPIFLWLDVRLSDRVHH